ncbi:MAG: hypothetical protein ABH879_04220 [archaeon]
MSKGRPVHSEIRQKIIEILFFMKKGYGYEIYKVYAELFPKVTMRSIYYNLSKGVQLGELKVSKVKLEKGDYSWGTHAEKVYYALGRAANPKIDPRVKAYFESDGPVAQTG